MSKLTDYGTLILAYLGDAPGRLHSTAEVAENTGLAATTVSKLLKRLAKAGLVTSTRGAQGGYALARTADTITAAEVIDALEGPVALTACSQADGHCDLESTCLVGGAWQRVNVAIRQALGEISLAQLTGPPAPLPRPDLRAAVTGRDHARN